MLILESVLRLRFPYILCFYISRNYTLLVKSIINKTFGRIVKANIEQPIVTIG